MNPAILNETVLVAKEFLDGELAKYETWEEFCADKSISTTHFKFENAKSFAKTKQQGVGRDLIHKFLGNNFKQWQIQEALETLNNELIDRGKLDP